MHLRRGRARLAAVLALIAAIGTACGTRVSRADVVAAAGGGPVRVISAPTDGTTDGAVAVPVTPSAAPTAATAPRVLPTKGALARGRIAVPVAAIGGGPATQPGSAPATPGSTGPLRSATPGAAACRRPGSTITFGQVGTFSGVIGASIGAAQPGLKVWARQTNADGGIACHPVRVISIDDDGDAGKAQNAVEELAQDGAVAINAFVPVTLNGIESAVDSAQMPVIGGDVTLDAWNTDPNFFPQGTAFAPMMYDFMKFAAQEGGHRATFLQCIEASGCALASKYIREYGDSAGLTLTSVQPISLAGTNFTQQCQNARQQDDDVVIIAAGATAVTAIGRDCADQRYHPRFLTLGIGATNRLESDPNLDGLTLGLPSFPWMDDRTPAERRFLAAISRYAPDLDSSGSASQAWTSGELLKKAIESLGADAYGDLTPALVARGLHTLRGETLGGLAPGVLTFPAGAPATPDKCAYFASIVDGRWGAPIGDQQVCAP
ncbi:MAG TPA: ABC transporter substrate-binding protein [Mycobacteriales bacterium]|nr:ABC transporter substrate-binding protein [Mycobacteriales bacterium]